ncbi:MAG: hypothetical protein JNK05_01480 [Myxococcales bacterium]|nr:hypothetical protein [Myxococcales bacterium]
MARASAQILRFISALGFVCAVLPARAARSQALEALPEVRVVTEGAGCPLLDAVALARLLELEWRDPATSQGRASTTVSLACEPTSVRVSLVDRGQALRTRVIEVGPTEWTVAPRIVALVAAQLATSIEREQRERAEAAARAATISSGPPAVVPASVERRIAIEFSGGARVWQWERPWFAASVAGSTGIRVGTLPLWVGASIEGEFATLSATLGVVSFARGVTGPWVGWMSSERAVLRAHARAMLAAGAQAFWATSQRGDVTAGSLAAFAFEGRVRTGVSVRVAAPVALGVDFDAAYAAPLLEGTLGDNSALRAGGLSLGAHLALRVSLR